MQESDKFISTPEDIAQPGLRYTKDQWEQILSQAEDYVREKPTQSLLYAIAAGFILNQLPIRRVLGGSAIAVGGFQTGNFDLRRDEALSGSAARRVVKVGAVQQSSTAFRPND